MTQTNKAINSDTRPLSMDPMAEMPPCRACGKKFAKGERVVLVPLGPGYDQEEREKMYQGKHYLSVAIPIHWDCAAMGYRK